MTELVINAPHLQTGSQRVGATGLSVIGWLMWCYFFFPLVTLGCWLVDDDICSQWVNMAGGYLSLQEMLAFYGKTVVGIAMLWSLWVVYNLIKQYRERPVAMPVPVSREDLCAAFNVKPDELAECQQARYAVVHFDQHGHIIGLERA